VAALSLRNRFDSVARSTADAFASRNNDVDGWWAPGLLLDALSPGDSDYRIDLLTGNATPTPTDSRLISLGPAWAAYFSWSIERHGLAKGITQAAELVLTFDRITLVPGWIPGARDSPFTCRVTVVHDTNHKHEAVVAGHCSRLSEFQSSSAPERKPWRSTGRGQPPRVLERIGGPPNEVAGTQATTLTSVASSIRSRLSRARSGQD